MYGENLSTSNLKSLKVLEFQFLVQYTKCQIDSTFLHLTSIS